jgi:DNA polymerase-3 subunit alpha/error-prone DNA polymerase
LPDPGAGARGYARSGAERGTPGRELRFWALVVADKDVATERGERMQFVTFEDETGLAEAVAFPPVLRRRQRPYRVGDIVSVRGRSTLQDKQPVLEVL